MHAGGWNSLFLVLLVCISKCLCCGDSCWLSEGIHTVMFYFFFSLPVSRRHSNQAPKNVQIHVGETLRYVN